MTETTLSKQLDKTYMLAVKHGLNEAAEFIKGLIVKYDVVENKKKGKKK